MVNVEMSSVTTKKVFSLASENGGAFGLDLDLVKKIIEGPFCSLSTKS